MGSHHTLGFRRHLLVRFVMVDFIFILSKMQFSSSHMRVVIMVSTVIVSTSLYTHCGSA